MSDPTIHILRAGVTLCGVPWTQRLGRLSPLDLWTGENEAEVATCFSCKAAARPTTKALVDPKAYASTPPWLRPRPQGPAPELAAGLETKEALAGDIAAREAEQGRDVRAIDRLGPAGGGRLPCGCSRCGCLCAEHAPGRLASPCPDHGRAPR